MTANTQNNPNQPQMFPQPPQRKSPVQFASVIADHIRAGLIVTAWIVLAALGIGVAYICICSLIWAIKQAQTALGI